MKGGVKGGKVFKRQRYKVVNWSEYNEALVRRGDICFYLDKGMLYRWQADREKRVGRPYKYSDFFISSPC